MARDQDTDERLTKLRARVSKVTTQPGVYRWLDADGRLLYVGKAKNLRKRMQTYVQLKAKNSAWTEMMVRQIADFDITVVQSELEAFILESNVIKELRPKYNIMLKDDKGYVYVRVTNDSYPVVEIVRRLEKDKATYFGPFTSGAKVTEQTLAMLDQLLHFRACTSSIEFLNAGKPLTGSPCLNQQIGKCCGLCIGLVSHEEYRSRIEEVSHFFRGHYLSVKQRALEQMKQLAREQKFERAAKVRDVLNFIEDLEKRQIISDTSRENMDVFGIALQHGKIQVVLLKQREGKVIHQLSFALKGEADSTAEALSQFLPQYYEDTQDIPDQILLGDELPESDLFAAWLRNRRGKIVKILVPERGRKSKLLLMAEENAREKVEQQFAAWEAEIKTIDHALQELAHLLHLPSRPRRIEGYDISHLGGSATVGSMVVMIQGKPKRDHYRSFNMKSLQEGDIDDYRSLQETLRRRLSYLTNDVKTVTSRLEKEGIVISKAKKADQKNIELLSKERPDHMISDPVSYKDYIVARRGDDIIGMCRMCTLDGTVSILRSLWVKESERGHHLSHILMRTLLAGVKKGKVYLHCPHESLLEHYSAVGFQPVDTPPDALARRLLELQQKNPEMGPGIVMVYIASKQKPDDSLTDHPDLLLIDGGKGQLGVVVHVLQELGLNIPVASLAKREEEIFLPDQPVSLAVPSGSPARFLLQRLRDEAHRFANDRRERRLKTSLFQSKLDEVPGIGDVLKSKLLKTFGSADFVVAASDEELSRILNQSQLAALRKRFPRINP